jgi:hypothetical protein
LQLGVTRVVVEGSGDDFELWRLAVVSLLVPGDPGFAYLLLILLPLLL